MNRPVMLAFWVVLAAIMLAMTFSQKTHKHHSVPYSCPSGGQ